MKAHVKNICASVLAAFVIVPLWVMAFPGRGGADSLALCASIVIAVNGYLWATEEGE